MVLILLPAIWQLSHSFEHFGHHHGCTSNQGDLHIDSHDNGCNFIHFFKNQPNLEFANEIILNASYFASNESESSENLTDSFSIINLSSRAPPYKIL